MEQLQNQARESCSSSSGGGSSRNSSTQQVQYSYLYVIAPVAQVLTILIKTACYQSIL